MSSTYSPEIRATTVIHGFTEVDGVKIAYREAGDANSPKLVLFHGWPSSSHQYRNLIPKLADRFHVIAPDYPGFGDSDAPDPETFSYTFDKLAEVIGHFLEQKGFTKFGMYVQDYGNPVGFRVASKRPEALQWLIIQNTNAYESGFTAAWGTLRNQLWKERNAESEAANASLLELGTVKAVYLTGSSKPELIIPDNWILTITSPCNGSMEQDSKWICSTTTGRTWSSIRSGKTS